MHNKFKIFLLISLLASFLLLANLTDLVTHSATEQYAKAATLQGSTFTITTALNNQENPALVYNIDTQEYLVAWVDEDNIGSGTDISARRLSNSGMLEGEEIVVSEGLGAQREPDITIKNNLAISNSSEYLIVWRDHRNDGVTDNDIWGRVVGNDGTLLSSETPISERLGRQREPAVGYCPSSDSYFTIWDEDEDANAQWRFYIFWPADIDNESTTARPSNYCDGKLSKSSSSTNSG